jgi:hypothetical protein
VNTRTRFESWLAFVSSSRAAASSCCRPTPLRSSTCILKPPALPMPRTAGGGTTIMDASCRLCRMLVLARACTTAVFMTYPACLGSLIGAWQMTATRAGVVQGAFTASFAVSLLVVSFLYDRFGAKSVFAWGAISCAASALFFATFARSFENALVCMALLGLAQGATYACPPSRPYDR